MRTHNYVYHMGGHAPQRSARLMETTQVFTEDCFNGRLTHVDGRPREVAPFPNVNPLAGPIHVEGIAAGDGIAIHLARLTPTRDWGVATISPDFGLLSGTRLNPNLQPAQDEHVWIWRFDETGTRLTTEAANGAILDVPFHPFHGTLGVAPRHGEIRLGVTAGDYGGNLDIPDLGPGATLYLRANVDGAHVYIGDGHYSQGDGEVSGTAIEGAFDTTLLFGRFTPDASLDWPRLETKDTIGVIASTRPLDDACRIAVAGLVHWVADLTGLAVMDAHQLVSQCCRLRIGNLVNPVFSVLCTIEKSRLGLVTIHDGLHDRLRALVV